MAWPHSKTTPANMVSFAIWYKLWRSEKLWRSSGKTCEFAILNCFSFEFLFCLSSLNCFCLFVDVTLLSHFTLFCLYFTLFLFLIKNSVRWMFVFQKNGKRQNGKETETRSANGQEWLPPRYYTCLQLYQVIISLEISARNFRTVSGKIVQDVSLSRLESLAPWLLKGARRPL